MKKRYFLTMALIVLALVFFSITTIINAEDTGIKINKSNFPNKRILNDVKQADKNGDGILQDKENRELKHVGIASSYKIIDLKGVSLLKYVESFYLVVDKEDTQEVKNFDEIYRLKKLKNLQVSCIKLKIKSLDVSKFPSLEYLLIGRLNQLENITFGNNKKLKEIEIRFSKSLKKLDFSKLTNLRKLRIDDVPVEYIKFGKNNKTIRRLSIFTSYTANTHFSKLDLSKLKKLKKLQLEDCNKITSLDLSKNPNLEEILLQTASKIQKLDFTHNKNLKNIGLFRTGIRDIVIPKDNCLEKIMINENKYITKFDTEILKADLITDLYFNKTPLKELDASKFYNLERISTSKKTKVIYPTDGHDYRIVNPK